MGTNKRKQNKSNTEKTAKKKKKKKKKETISQLWSPANKTIPAHSAVSPEVLGDEKQLFVANKKGSARQSKAAVRIRSKTAPGKNKLRKHTATPKHSQPQTNTTNNSAVPTKEQNIA